MTDRVAGDDLDDAGRLPRQPSRERGDGEVTVLGTAHVSHDSVAEVEETIERERPDVVAVELDEGRFRQMKGETPDELEPGDVLRGNSVFQFMAYWMLSYIQTRMGDRFDIEPGADMMAAVDTAEEHGLGVALVDRDIQTTMQRFWARMGFFAKLKLVGSLVLGLAGFGGGSEEMEDIDMDDLTDADVVTVLMEEFRQFSPEGAEALIDERDAYIAHRLVALREAGYTVVAVVGAGHREGVERYLAHPEELPPMESLVGTASGRRFSLYKVFGYAVTLGFLAFFVLLALGGASNRLLVEVFAAWFLVNAVCAGGLAKLAGARWPSALVGGGIAWMTSVNPLLAPGWFAGYVELRYRTVSVGDISTLNEILDDEEAPIRELFGRMKQVPLFNLILVVALTNIGSMVASLVVFPAVLPFLSADVGGVGAIGGMLVDGVQNGADIVWEALT